MSWQDKIRNPNCTDCALHKDAEYVCLMGSGKKKAKLMIVGEAPGAREDEQHAAFVGPAGKLLDTLLDEVGISRKDCYITNAVKCRPKDNDTPSRAQAKACSPYLANEVVNTDARVILALGNTALQATTGKSGITKHRGKVYPLGSDRSVIATFHPAAALRSSRYLPQIQADFLAVARRLEGDDSGQLRTRVRLINDPAKLKLLARKIANSPRVAFDLETTGLRAWEENVRIVTFGVSWAPGEAAVIPIAHATMKNDGWWESLVYQTLKEVMQDPSKGYIAHNGKFDCGWLARFGVYVPLTFDTMIAAHMLDENRPKGLKPLSQMLLGADDYAEDTKDCWNAPLKKLAIYNGKDCDYTLRLYEIFKEQLKAEPRIARVFKLLMMPASDMFMKIEAGGIYVDPDRLTERIHLAQRNVAKIERYMMQFTKQKSINFNSPAQVAVWLFNELKLPIVERTKTNAPSTREAVLLQLSGKHKAVDALLKYRKWAKYLSTYLGPWDRGRDAKSRIHPTYRLTGTTTGRTSSAEPNLQQVPRDPLIRGIIGAPNGWRLVEADYSQIELRLAAMAADEKVMKKVLEEGEDLHTNTAQSILHKEKITKDQRVIWGKHPNFGLVFGMGPGEPGKTGGYHDYCRDNGIDITYDAARAVHAGFHRTYPRLRTWHARQGRLVRANQRVSSPIGRVRHLPDVQSENKSVRAEAERQAINSPIQGFASDLCLLSALRLAQTLDHRVARIVGTVHDALLLEVREEHVGEVAKLVKATMEDVEYVRQKFGTIIDVPIVAEVEVSTHWSEED